MTIADACARHNLDAETATRLETYLALMQRWRKSINLTSPQADLVLHLNDCLLALPLLPPGTILADVGSGNGFPGVVLAICGHEAHLFESDQRKAVFLAESLRVTASSGKVHTIRVETYTGPPFDAVTARGFASIAKTLALTAPLRHPDTRLLTWKRTAVPEEIAEASKEWQFEATELMGSHARIVALQNIRRTTPSPKGEGFHTA